MAGVKTFLIAFALLLGVLLPAKGRAAGEFETANQLYDADKFSEAKAQYEKLIAAGAGANAYYNLANIDFRLGDIGSAILNYERALSLQPQHPEALANLRLLRQRSGAKLIPEAWSDQWGDSQSANTWVMVTAIAGWVTIFSLALLVTGVQRGRGWVWLLTVVGLIASGLGATAVWTKYQEQSMAIITAPEVQARLAPAEVAAVAEALPVGSQVRVVSERGPWVYCQLPGSGSGWIEREKLAKIRKI